MPRVLKVLSLCIYAMVLRLVFVFKHRVKEENGISWVRLIYAGCAAIFSY